MQNREKAFTTARLIMYINGLDLPSYVILIAALIFLNLSECSF